MTVPFRITGIHCKDEPFVLLNNSYYINNILYINRETFLKKHFPLVLTQNEVPIVFVVAVLETFGSS